MPLIEMPEPAKIAANAPVVLPNRLYRPPIITGPAPPSQIEHMIVTNILI